MCRNSPDCRWRSVIAVARALEHLGVPDVGLKWPNDILLDGGKVGGILVELEAAPGAMLAVIGIGLNLQLPPAGEDEFLHRPAALSQALSLLPDRHQLLAQLLIDLAAVLDRFVEGGFSVLRSDWQGPSCLAGSPGAPARRRPYRSPWRLSRR
jgi:BirA family biotin operon repressor/biotin-[acetyl-CoA-carboxylase] ligase